MDLIHESLLLVSPVRQPFSPTLFMQSFEDSVGTASFHETLLLFLYLFPCQKNFPLGLFDRPLSGHSQ